MAGDSCIVPSVMESSPYTTLRQLLEAAKAKPDTITLGINIGGINHIAVQMAWRWLRHQPESALCKWFEERTAGARGRIRRVMIVALARKLPIALWRFCETGLVPTGARCA